MSKEFYETRRLFIPYVNYTCPISFVEWLCLPDDKKAAHLYCQFFDEIVLAWYKSKSFYAEEQEGVETIMQYLIKNVDKIKADSKRYSSAYIYRIAYNCLYCISHDRKSDKWRYDNEISNYQQDSSGDTVNLFDFCSTYDTYDIESDGDDLETLFWKSIESCDKYAKALAEDLCDRKKCLKTLSKRDLNTLRKIRENILTILPFYYKDEVLNKIIEEICSAVDSERK